MTQTDEGLQLALFEAPVQERTAANTYVQRLGTPPQRLPADTELDIDPDDPERTIQ